MILDKDSVKRCVIFLFFDKDGIVDDYICHMLRDLRKSVEYVLVISNGYVERESLTKLKVCADEVYCRANLGLDIGGYREGLFYLGFRQLAYYDEVILMNYTFFAPLFPFSEMFDEMVKKDLDFWGITKHHRVDPDPFGMLPYGYLPDHIQSFFLALRPSLFLSYQYKDFIFNMQNPDSYQKSIVEYETIFTKHFEDLGFKWDVYVNTDEYEGYSYCPNMFYIKEMISKKRCPIIKRRSFFTDYTDFLLNSCGESSVEAYEYIKYNLDYDENEIWDNILRLESISDVHRDMHFNYILPEYGTVFEKAQSEKTAIFLGLESGKRLNWYKRFLKTVPSWFQVYLLGNDDNLMSKVEKIINENKAVEIVRVRCNVVDYLEFLRTVSEYSVNYNCLAILYMSNVEKYQPYSNDVSWQFSDWKNIIGSGEYTMNVLETFAKNPRLGMLVPPVPNFGRLFADIADGWMGRFSEVCETLNKLDIKLNVRKETAPTVPIGGSFWIRGKILANIFRKLKMVKKLDKELLLLMMPFLVQDCSEYTGVVYSEQYAAVSVTNKDYMFRETNKVVFDKYGANYHNVCVANIKNDLLV